MARIFAGNTDARLRDDALVSRLATLGDEYVVMLNAIFGKRECDIAIFRASEDPAVPSTLIATEVKRVSHPVRGDVNGRWDIEVAPGCWEPMPGNGRDTSPFQQAVNTANELKGWLYNHQRLVRDEAADLPERSFRVWPDLLLISPPGITHRLPLAPSSNYGKWFDDPDRWFAHVRAWRGKEGIVGLNQRELGRIVELLRLEPLGPVAPATAPAPRPAPPSLSVAIAAAAPAPSALLAELAGIEQQIALLQRNVAQLRQTLGGGLAA